MDEKSDEKLIKMLFEAKAYMYANRNRVIEMINLVKWNECATSVETSERHIDNWTIFISHLYIRLCQWQIGTNLHCAHIERVWSLITGSLIHILWEKWRIYCYWLPLTLIVTSFIEYGKIWVKHVEDDFVMMIPNRVNLMLYWRRRDDDDDHSLSFAVHCSHTTWCDVLFICDVIILMWRREDTCTL